jgi:hypothetical protein
MKTVREEMLELMARHADIEGLRRLEHFWQQLNAEHGPRPLLSKGLKRISKLIQFLEIGE